MNFIRKTYIVLATLLLSTLVFVGAVTLSLNLTLGKPDHLKRWLAQSKIYDNVVQAVIEKSQSVQPSSNNEIDALAVSQVQTALKQAVTPTFLRTSTENILDGTYAWLEGKTSKPVYSIDLSSIKNAFANNLTDAAQAHLASLPACTAKNQPTTNDPFSLTCRPPADVSNAGIQQIIDQINNSGIFQQNNLNADSIMALEQQAQQATPDTTTSQTTTPAPTTTKTTSSTPWYQNVAYLPTVYHWTMVSPFIYMVVCMLLAAGLLFAAQTKRSGLKIIAGTLLSAGILLMFGAGVSLVGGQVAQGRISHQDTASLYQPIVSLVQAISHSISLTQLWIGIGLVVVSVATYIILAATAPKTTATKAPAAAEAPQTKTAGDPTPKPRPKVQ